MLFEPLRTLEDWLDQFLHALWGASMTFLFSINIPLWLAAFLTMGFAAGREVLYQHPGQCGAGCRTDLLGWAVGILAGGALWFFLL